MMDEPSNNSTLLESNTGMARVLRRWPSLPLLSLGFLISWVLVMFSGTVRMPGGLDSVPFYVVMLLVCVLAMAFPHRFGSVMRAKPSAISCGILAAVGTLALAFPSVAVGAPDVLLAGVGAVGSMFAGVGMACMTLCSIELLGRLAPTEIWVWMAYSELAVVGIYFTVAGVGGVAAIAITALLPLLVGICVSLGNVTGSKIDSARADRKQTTAPPGMFAKYFLFVASLSLTASLCKLIAIDAIPAAGPEGGLVWPAVARVALALAILLAVVFFSKRFPFSKMGLFVIVITVGVLCCLVLSIADGSILFFMTTLVHSSLECVAFAFAACLVFMTSGDSWRIATLPIVALNFGPSVEDIVELAGIGVGTLPVLQPALIASAAVSLVFALFFLQERAFDDLLGSVEESLGPWGASRKYDEDESQLDLSEFGRRFNLTQRELDVLDRLRGGNTASRIADDMGLSVNTLRGYIQNIYAKCGVHSRDELLDLLG